jgi:hypothetical protein
MAAAALLAPPVEKIEEKIVDVKSSTEKPATVKGKVDPKAPAAPVAPVEPKVRNQEDISNERNQFTS